MTSGTANNGYGHISSAQSGRFMFVHPHLYRAAIRIPALGVAKCTRRWGALTVSGIAPHNGFFFSLNENDSLSVNCVSDGTVSSVPSGEFNGPVVHSFTMNDKVHAYEVEYFEMAALFSIDGLPMHRFTPATEKLAMSLHHFAVATSVNDADGTASGSIEMWAASILRLGQEVTAPKYVHVTTAGTQVLKLGPGTLHAIVINNAGGTLVTAYDNTAASGPANRRHQHTGPRQSSYTQLSCGLSDRPDAGHYRHMGPDGDL